MVHARVGGLDLGKARAKLVVARVADGGRLEVERTWVVTHEGRPLDAFRRLYREADAGALDALGTTGLFAQETLPPALCGLPEEACLEAALAEHPELAGALGVVSVGARGYAVLGRDEVGRLRWLESDKCSSGTGETMVKMAARFGFSLEEADRAAGGAADSIAISSRCSVFAKSELTHFANQGRPTDQLLRGYLESVARHVGALVARASVTGPLYLVGGAATLETFRRALAEVHHGEVFVPAEPLLFEALGAARLAADQLAREALAPLPREPEPLLRRQARRFRTLDAPSDHRERVEVLTAAPLPPGAERTPCVLGLDLGSTGSKAVLTSVATGEAVLDLYDRTRGNPVEAAMRLLDALAASEPDVRAIGVTGSGREAVATVARAAFPTAAERIVVLNEIVAHATAAIRCDPDHGRSLSVVEIGGQDAKFIQIAGGQIVESDMNQACSAGTGSFLEEQAALYGIEDIRELTRLAQRATHPPDLGQTCTVFVAEAAAEAQREGFSLEDLFGGFQYAVIHNYRNRVMGNRTFGERVFFQGKPASGPSLAWTLAAVTGRRVMVPPNPGAMGAWGIGLCARDELGVERLQSEPALELEALRGARIVERDELRCRDPRCATYCPIDRAVVSVGNARRTVLSGGACPKFEVSSASRPKLPADAPSPFDEREALLAPWLTPRRDGPVVRVPRAGPVAAALPWVVALLDGLGLAARVVGPDKTSLAAGEALCRSFDACAPAKIAHALVAAEPGEEDAPAVLFPKLVGLPDHAGDGGRTCPMEQGMPELGAQAAAARGTPVRLVAPVLDLRDGPDSPVLLTEVARAALALGADPTRVPEAVARAFRALDDFQRELDALGARALAYAAEHGIPAVVVCGPVHVITDPAISSGIPSILRQHGVVPLPMDAFPLPADTPVLERAVWGDGQRALRVAAAARLRGDVYPLLLSSFGCGPASFVEHAFEALAGGHPHTTLETDGHGGSAGFVTRIQAFLHAVRQHDRRPSAPPEISLRVLAPLVERDLADERGSRIVVPPLGDRFSAMLAAVYGGYGFDAAAAGPSTALTLAAGRSDCSGKECLPYQLVWGAFREELRVRPPERRTVLLQVTGDGACRNCMFSVKDQLELDRLGLSERVAMRHLHPEARHTAGMVARLWWAVVAWDVLYQLRCWHRAIEPSAGDADALYHRLCDELQAILERRQPEGLAAVRTGLRDWHDVRELVSRGAREFARLGGGRGEDLPVVLLGGDFYLRLDEWGSERLAARLAALGTRVLVEPLAVLGEYLGYERTSDLLGLPAGPLEAALHRSSMALIRRSLYGRARALHPWLPMPDVARMVELSRELIDRSPVGEAPITVGSALAAWEHGCDGVVLVSPWGCGPALVAEGVLASRPEIPLLTIYADGSPIDERRLRGFAFRLRRSRRGAAPTATRLAESG